jgi:hypothetical protein
MGEALNSGSTRGLPVENGTYHRSERYRAEKEIVIENPCFRAAGRRTPSKSPRKFLQMKRNVCDFVCTGIKKEFRKIR